MARLFSGLAIAASIIAVVACTTARGYVVCNDMAANVTCPDNTANVVVK
jgi:hypothetical protein